MCASRSRPRYSRYLNQKQPLVSTLGCPRLRCCLTAAKSRTLACTRRNRSACAARAQRRVARRKKPKKLSDREHVCTKCGLITTRDHASATEILRLGLSLHTLTKSEIGTCVVWRLQVR